MKRYQLALLYGGGAALSAFILLCSVLAVWMAASDYNAAARASFLTQESGLLVSMTGAGAVLKRGTGYAEGVWDSQGQPSAALREQYLSHNGQLWISQDSGRRVYAVATEVTDVRPASSFLPLLAMVEKQLKSSIVLTRTPELSANTYFYSVQGDFLATLLRSGSGYAVPSSRLPDALRLFREAWPDVVSLTQAAVAHPEAAPADVVWMAPQFDPLSGELMVRFAQFLFDSDRRPLGIVVANRRPGRFLNGLQNPFHGGEFAILDGRGKVLFINDVQDVSKVEAGQLTFESIPFRCDQLLQDVRDTFAPLAEAKGLALTCEIAPGAAGHFLGDPTRIRQVIANLVSNAIKFTEAGHVAIRAGFVQDNEVSVVQFEIADTGIGMDPAVVPTLFALYTQADSSIHRRYGGTGLGLPLCRRIVEAVQGHISVDTTPGQGTTFTVRWPLQRTEAPSHGARDGGAMCAKASDAASAVESDDGEPAIRVLVAEDHPATRAMLADQLGFEATIVEHGAKALEALAHGQYDIVLTDIGMPVMDGYALASAIRQQYPRLAGRGNERA